MSGCRCWESDSILDFRFWIFDPRGGAFNLLLSLPFCIIVNLFISRARALQWAIRVKSDPIELLLNTCIAERKMVLITVKNGKVYIGNLTMSLNPATPIEAIGILPNLSGYRKADDKTVEFTTDYMSVYKARRAAMKAKLEARFTGLVAPDMPEPSEKELREIFKLLSRTFDLNDFQIVIPMAEIQSISTFDPDVYTQHFVAAQATYGEEAAASDDIPGHDGPSHPTSS